MNIQKINGTIKNNLYRIGYEIRIQCHQGFYFPDGSTEKVSKCVDLGAKELEWSSLDSCYPRNYLSFNIIKI